MLVLGNLNARLSNGHAHLCDLSARLSAGYAQLSSWNVRLIGMLV